jgi:DNA (cytosine-5)-methyltransferase 1
MRVLDLFCGAGGASQGLHLAGFELTGVDIKDQPNYPFNFIKADASQFDLSGYDFIWASPPCQAHSSLNNVNKKFYQDFIPIIRSKLQASGKPYVIENVKGAPLINPTILCGSSFGLNVWRHRLFESNFLIRPIGCQHKLFPKPIDVTGTGGYIPHRVNPNGGNSRKPRNMKEASEAMGIDWMTRKEISQAIPPAYSQYIGKELLRSLNT